MLYNFHNGKAKERFATPTGWTSAEVFLALRDCLLREEGGALVIGSGVPEEWLESDFYAENMPTHFGKASFWYNANERTVKAVCVKNPPNGIRADFTQNGKVRHDMRLGTYR